MKINEKDLKHNNDMLVKFKGVLAKKRVAVFIDAANVYFGAQKKGIHLNYETLANWFEKNTQNPILNFYTAFNPGDEKQEEFLKEIESFGYNAITKPVKIFADTNRKGNMDIELCVDAMRQKDDFDIIVLMSGDGDFQYLFKTLKEYGKKTLVLGVGGFTSFDLHNEADYFFFINRVKSVWHAKKKEDKQYFIYLDELSDIDYKTEEKKQKKPEKKSLIEKKMQENNNLKITNSITQLFENSGEIQEKLDKLKKLKIKTLKTKPKVENEKKPDLQDFMQALPYDKAEELEKPLQQPTLKLPKKAKSKLLNKKNNQKTAE